VLESSEDVLDGTPSQCHRVQVSVKTPLHGLDHRFVFPKSHAAFVARGAAKRSITSTSSTVWKRGKETALATA
jgi:hypothetical protein